MQYLDANKEINAFWYKYGTNHFVNSIWSNDVYYSSINGYYTYQYAWLYLFITNTLDKKISFWKYNSKYIIDDPCKMIDAHHGLIQKIGRIICDMLCILETMHLSYINCIACDRSILISNTCACADIIADFSYIPPQILRFRIGYIPIKFLKDKNKDVKTKIAFFFGYNGNLNDYLFWLSAIPSKHLKHVQAQIALINLSKHAAIHSRITRIHGPVCSFRCFRIVCTDKTSNQIKILIVQSFIKFDNDIKSILKLIPIVIERLISKYLCLSVRLCIK